MNFSNATKIRMLDSRGSIRDRDENFLFSAASRLALGLKLPPF
jgi:hypothetical protein